MSKLVITLLISVSLLLNGCSTSKEEMFPHSGQTMMDVWSKSTQGNMPLNDARMELKRALTDDEMTLEMVSYTRTSRTEIDNLFQRLPNPDLIMYVFAHLSDGDAPVPGYSTVFPFYNQVKYAMPGERTRGY